MAYIVMNYPSVHYTSVLQVLMRIIRPRLRTCDYPIGGFAKRYFLKLYTLLSAVGATYAPQATSGS